MTVHVRDMDLWAGNPFITGYPNLYPMPLDTVPATYKKPVVVVPEADTLSRTPWLQAIGQKHGKDLSTGYIIVQPLAADCTLSFPFASHSASSNQLTNRPAERP